MKCRGLAWSCVLFMAPAIAIAQPAQPAPSEGPPVPAPPLPTPDAAEPAPPTSAGSSKPPAPPPDLPPPGFANDPTAVAGYQDGLYIATRDDAFRFGIQSWLQARWEIGDASGDVAQRFALPVGRITFAGHAFSTVDLRISTEVGQGTVELTDAFIDQPVFGGKLHLRFGQFKPLFSHQQTLYRSELQFTDRPITAAFTGFLRDLGASVHHEPRGRSSGIELAAGVFNGAGVTPTSNCIQSSDPITMDPSIACTPPTTSIEDGRPLAVARIGWRGDRVDVERDDDLDHGHARAAVGVGYAVDLADGEARDMVHVITADLLFKGHGVSFGAAGFLKSARLGGERTWELAWHSQLGYALVPHIVELAARFAQVPLAVGDRQAQEATGVVNVYRNEHRLKWQLEAGVMRLTGIRDLDWVARAQTQLVF
ncbi:MAG: hypothetical protein AB7O24_21185 [Kofleriaceae bacterium]